MGSLASEISTLSGAIGGLSNTVGGSVAGLSGISNNLSNIAGGVGQVSGVLGAFGAGGKTSGGTSYVPTKSSFSITLQPVYSRDNVRKFSLDRFVSGGYLNNVVGYI